MPDELQDRFWSIPDNAAAMTLIGYRFTLHQPAIA
jgi:hypothetical protein